MIAIKKEDTKKLNLEDLKGWEKLYKKTYKYNKIA